MILTEGTRAASVHPPRCSISSQALDSIWARLALSLSLPSGLKRQRQRFPELLKTLGYLFPLCIDEHLPSKSHRLENPCLKIPKYLHPHSSWKTRPGLQPLALWSHKHGSLGDRAAHPEGNHLLYFKKAKSNSPSSPHAV